MKKAEQNGKASSNPETDVPGARPHARLSDGAASAAQNAGSKPPVRRGSVAKVSHTLSIALAERLEEFAFFQRVSESAVIEHSLAAFFAQSTDDGKLGDQLRRSGAGRRRKSG